MGLFKRRNKAEGVKPKGRSGEEIAAIALALHLYGNEVNVGGRRVVSCAGRGGSAWNSKAFGMSEMPERRFGKYTIK